MRALVQRVQWAKVVVDGVIVSEIGSGLLTFLGIGKEDSELDLEWVMGKVSRLRVFEDSAGKMNLSLSDVGGEHLIVSQFTLFADTKKGNRPSFVDAAPPGVAEPLY